MVRYLEDWVYIIDWGEPMHTCAPLARTGEINLIISHPSKEVKKMAANAREVDTGVWLNNKLSNDDMWSGANIWTILTTDILRNIPDCFHNLHSQVKIKILMSFLYIPRRHAQDMSSQLNDILEVSFGDSDDWVRILSEILRNFPETGRLNVDLADVSPVFSEILQDIRLASRFYSLSSVMFYV